MKRAYSIFCFSILSLLLASCNPDGTGIFLSISTERVIKDSVFLDRTVNRIVADATDYYASAGSVFKRPISDPSGWNKLPIPSGYERSLDVAYFSTPYAIFATSSSSSGLFTWNGSSWSSVATGADGMMTDLFVEGNTLFVQSQLPSAIESVHTYRLYSSSDGSTFSAVNFDESETLAYPVKDVAHNGADFFVISGPDLYQGTETYLTPVEGAPSSSDFFVGLFWTGSIFYLAREGVGDGAVFTSSDGSSWSTLNSTLDINPDVADFAGYNNDSADIVLLGGGMDKDKNVSGYYESINGGSFGTPSSSYSAGDDYSDLSLSENPVRRFFVFGDDVFACPAGDGLWLRDRVSGNWDRN